MKIQHHPDNPSYIAFFCPGCEYLHSIYVGPLGVPGADKISWGFNGDDNKPTITPSILNRTGKFADPDWKEPDEPGVWSTICHCFVRDGNIQFLNDCTHKLKGQTVPLPDL